MGTQAREPVAGTRRPALWTITASTRAKGARSLHRPPRHLVGADPRADGSDRARARPARPRPRSCATAISSPSCSSSTSPTSSPTTGSTSTSRACKVGRIQNFRSWSPEMVPDEQARPASGSNTSASRATACGPPPTSELIALAKQRARERSASRSEDDVKDGCVVRQKKAYPVYDDELQGATSTTIRDDIAEAHYPTLHLVGRNGMHKYNNQDHAMMTAMLTVREHPRRRDASTTCGTSTRTPSTTRPASRASRRRSRSVRLVPGRVRSAA